jgi:isohexenylglutaconyl-CoA hydratase
VPAPLPPCEYLSLDLDDYCLTVVFDRSEARNAMNVAMADEVEAVVAAAASRPEISVIVFRAQGRHFCAGGDLKDMTEVMEPPATGAEDRLYWVNRRFGDLLTRIDSVPQVVISVVQGAARGAGFGIACVSDVVIAHENATFAMPETGLGLPPAQILPFVAMRLGQHEARRLALTGRPLTAADAHRTGLVHLVCAGEAAATAALSDLLDDIARRGPDALAEAKRLINQVGQVPLSLLLDRGARLVARSSRNGEGHEGLAAFVEKRPPAWASRADRQT